MDEVNDVLEETYPIVWKGERLRIQYGNYSINNSTSIQLMCWDEDTYMDGCE